jgi:hypothetical protein
MIKYNINTFLIVLFNTSLINLVSAQEHVASRLQDIKIPSVQYKRVNAAAGSFAYWLRNLPLKPKGSPVLDYRGLVYKKGSDTTVAAVVDWNIHGKRMEQCIDILVRFYAEFLWENKRKSEMIFPLPGGYYLKWNDWQVGMRPFFKGIDVTMKKITEPDSSRSSFESYLRTVFAESHTQQFYHSYQRITRRNVQIGDFIVKKGTKSHAIMIVDLALNNSGDLLALIGHGDTPACQFYLLNYKKTNPWFPLNFKEEKLPLPIRRIMTWDGLRRFSKK